MVELQEWTSTDRVHYVKDSAMIDNSSMRSKSYTLSLIHQAADSMCFSHAHNREQQRESSAALFKMVHPPRRRSTPPTSSRSCYQCWCSSCTVAETSRQTCPRSSGTSRRSGRCSTWNSQTPCRYALERSRWWAMQRRRGTRCSQGRPRSRRSPATG